MISLETPPLLSLHDVTLIPAPISKVASREECNPYYSKGLLPLATAPMDCVIDETNWEVFSKAGVLTVLPRTVEIKTRLHLMTKTFIGVSLKEFAEHFCAMKNAQDIFEALDQNDLKAKVCVDVANGHMQALIDLCRIAKDIFGERLILMAGNIANPMSYIQYANAGIDYVRVGIGTGSRCTTSANVAVHFPMASLLDSIRRIQMTANLPYYPKIVADGGFKNFDDIIKAIALGADFVMCGRFFAECKEACGTTHQLPNGDIEREYYGMSTKIAQKKMGKEVFRTSEGISRTVKVTHTLAQKIENFKDYLTSAMSYSNSYNLPEFQDKALVYKLTPEARAAYFK
jgi:IMP dehydrogenase/GMP reductase